MLTLIVGIGLLLDRAMVLDLGSMAKELSSETGKRIEVSDDLSRRIVYFDRRGVSALSSVKALATAVGGDVSETTDGYRISRSQETLHELKLSQEAVRSNWIVSRIKKVKSIREAARAKGPWRIVLSETISSEIQQLHPRRPGILFEPKVSASMLLPAQALLIGIVERIGPKALAKRPTGQSIVFELPSQQYTETLPNCDDLVAEFMRASREFSQINLPEKILKDSAELGLQNDITMLQKGITAPTRLRLHVLSTENEFIFDLEGYDGQGKRTLSSWLRCGPTEFHEAIQSLVAHDLEDPTSEWVTLTPSAAKAIEFSYSEEPAPLPRWYLAPVLQDPLEPFVKEALHALLRPASGQCTAVALSDFLWQHVALCSKSGRLDLTALRSSMQQWTPWTKISRQDALVLRPLDLLLDERNEANRKVLARVASDTQKGASLDLQHLAAFYYAALPRIGPSVACSNPLIWSWSRIGLTASGRQPMVQSIPACLLRFMGSMTDETWERLKSGSAVGVGTGPFREDLLAILAQDYPVQTTKKFADIYDHAIDVAAAVGVEKTTLEIKRSKDQVLRVWDHTTLKEPPVWGSVADLQYNLILPRGAIQWVGGEPEIKFSTQEFRNFMAKYSFRFANRVTEFVEIHLGPEASLVQRVLESPTDVTSSLSFSQLDEQTQTQLWKLACSGSIAMGKVVHGMAERARSAARSGQSSTNPTPMP